MSKSEKLLSRMRINPRGWCIEQLETVASWYDIRLRKSGGSHVVFTHQNWNDQLCVPAHRPIKPIYIKRFLILIDTLGDKYDK